VTRRAAFVLLAAVAAGGCSTHEFRFEGGVPPAPLTSPAQIATAHGIVETLLARFAPEGASLPPSATAAFAEAALLDAQGTGSVPMRRTAIRLADSLRRAGIPVGIGLGYPGAGGRRPDSLVTAEVARTLLYFDKVTDDRRWRSTAARAVQAMLSRRLGWTRVRDGYAVSEPGAERSFSVARTADAGVVLSNLAAVGGGPTAERYGRGATAVVRRAQTSPGRWPRALGSGAPMPVAERALTLYSLHSLPSKPDRDVVIASLPSLFEQAFHPWGEPRDGPLMGRRGVGAALALRTLQLQPGTSPSEHVARWLVAHRRSDGTFEAAAARDVTAQAYFTLAFAMRSYVFSNDGGLP
jgi:hypothetical protein